MNQTNTFFLGANNNPAPPIMPLPLSADKYNTRQDLREHKEAVETYHAYQQNLIYQAKVAADHALAKEKAEANREMTDQEYDAIGLKRFNDHRDKAAALLAKEKQDELDKVAYKLSSPPVVEINQRSEYRFIKDLEYWFGRQYTLEEDGLVMFQPGIYIVNLTAPAPTKKAAK